MRPHDSLDHRQAEARATDTGLPGRRAAFKLAKDAPLVRRRNAHAFITDMNGETAGLLRDCHPHGPTLGRILHGVIQEVPQGSPQSFRICRHECARDIGSKIHLEADTLGFLPEVGHCRINQGNGDPSEAQKVWTGSTGISVTGPDDSCQGWTEEMFGTAIAGVPSVHVLNWWSSDPRVSCDTGSLPVYCVEE